MAKKVKISVAIATYNEERNIRECLQTVVDWVDEVVVVDGGSGDKTVEVAREMGARVIETTNPQVFHINKAKAVGACNGEWILQLDADERVTSELKNEILGVVQMNQNEIEKRVIDGEKLKLFVRHQKLIEERDGPIGKGRTEIVAFFVPRLNYFLGGPIRYAGTYPDGVIRLFKNGKAEVPAESVHEQIRVKGRAAWLTYDLMHLSNPDLTRYIQAFARYTDIQSNTIGLGKGSGSDLRLAAEYILVNPIVTFISLYFRHKGMWDGWRGFLFCLFSSLHSPVAFIKRMKKI